MTVQSTELDGNRNGNATKAKSGVREEGAMNQCWESCASRSISRKKRVQYTGPTLWLFRMLNLESGDKSWWSRVLLYKHEDLSSDL